VGNCDFANSVSGDIKIGGIVEDDIRTLSGDIKTK
jgi:hypothetical protein